MYTVNWFLEPDAFVYTTRFLIMDPNFNEDYITLNSVIITNLKVSVHFHLH